MPHCIAFLLVAVALLQSSTVSAGPSDSRGRMILTLYGSRGFGYREQAGWGEGVSLGYALDPRLTLSAEYSYHRLTGGGNVHESTAAPVMLSLLVGEPFPHRIAPWVSFGIGTYRLTERGLYWSFFGPQQWEGSFEGTHRGIAIGGGVSVPLWELTSVELGVRYHQTYGGGFASDASTMGEASFVDIQTGIAHGFGVGEEPVRASPDRSPDGSRGRAILRLRGGFALWDPHGRGPGSMVGGAIGFGLSRTMLLLVNLERINPDDLGSLTRRSVTPLTIQMEIGAPFLGRVTPRLEWGFGAYVVRHMQPTYVTSGSTLVLVSRPGRRDSLLGVNLGGGISIPVARNVMVDLGVRYHQAGDLLGSKISEGLIMTTAGAGLTIALR